MTNKWGNGLTEWVEDETTFISVAFTWLLDDAYYRARFARSLGMRVRIGGPAVFLNQMKHRVFDVAEVGGVYPDAIIKHNQNATIASRGCPVGCWFCIVPAMEGKEFTFLPDFVPRPILCDNNLSALPHDYQDYIISRYKNAGVQITDANSGFEPRTFTPDIYNKWKPLINQGRGPWRFAYDDMHERSESLRVMKMLESEPRSRKRVYTLIGNEPFDDCMRRIQETIDNGCEPYAQPVMKLNALNRDPWVRFDWTGQLLKDVSRWVNGWVWKRAKFSEYSSSKKTRRIPETQSLLQITRAAPRDK
ncbi:MAG: hypothetical protein GY819_17525 [Planctomycetaceae bacterium]|nr:hypothetical protein [Planctomycetaceae bacterium]